MTLQINFLNSYLALRMSPFVVLSSPILFVSSYHIFYNFSTPIGLRIASFTIGLELCLNTINLKGNPLKSCPLFLVLYVFPKRPQHLGGGDDGEAAPPCLLSGMDDLASRLQAARGKIARGALPS